MRRGGKGQGVFKWGWKHEARQRDGAAEGTPLHRNSANKGGSAKNLGPFGDGSTPPLHGAEILEKGNTWGKGIRGESRCGFPSVFEGNKS